MFDDAVERVREDQQKDDPNWVALLGLALSAGVLVWRRATNTGRKTPAKVRGTWEDCRKILPYRDFLGRWRFPEHTQRRAVFINGERVIQFREREETLEEWEDRQWL